MTEQTNCDHSVVQVTEQTIDQSLRRFHEIVAALDGAPGVVVDPGRRRIRIAGLEILVDSKENPRARIVAL